MENTNKYNYYITLINMCDSLDNADALITEIADDETISRADYCKLYNLLIGKYQRLNEGLKPEQIPLLPYELNRRKAENLWTVIDLEDLERVLKFPYTWFAKFNKPINDYYACASEYIPELQHSRPLHLHQFIMNTRDNHVDHINHDPRDNRKENLRVILPNENLRNRESRNINNKSGFRNVSWDGHRWVVQLQINGKCVALGRFPYEQLEQAGLFAEQMRQKYYGEYAGNN